MAASPVSAFQGPVSKKLSSNGLSSKRLSSNRPASQSPGIQSTAAPNQGRPSSQPAKGRQNGRSVRIEASLALVGPIARHYAHLSPESADDLTQVGLLGLMRAAELYVPSRGLPFEPFARQHIRGAILHYLRDQAPMLRIPRRRQELEQQRRRHESRIEAELGMAPPPEAVRLAMGLTAAQWTRLDQAPARLRFVPLDFEAEAPHREEASLEDPRGPEAVALLAQLPLQQAEAIKAVILSGRSLRQVASDWQVSASTVHRHLHRGLAELRRRLESPSGAVAC